MTKDNKEQKDSMRPDEAALEIQAEQSNEEAFEQEGEGDDEEEGQTEGPAKKPLPQNAITRLYDKIPLTYKQVDIIAKVIVGITVLVLFIALVTAPGPKS